MAIHKIEKGQNHDWGIVNLSHPMFFFLFILISYRENSLFQNIYILLFKTQGESET